MLGARAGPAALFISSIAGQSCRKAFWFWGDQVVLRQQAHRGDGGNFGAQAWLSCVLDGQQRIHVLNLWRNSAVGRRVLRVGNAKSFMSFGSISQTEEFEFYQPSKCAARILFGIDLSPS